MTRTKGFTLIEMMIVVVILGILAAISLPKFLQLTIKSKEGATKGNLAAIRSALSVYYGDMEGQYPADPYSLTINSKYLEAIPMVKTPGYHDDSTGEVLGSMASGFTDASGWAYDAQHSDTLYGSVWVNCTHTDAKSTTWTAY